MLAIDVMVLRSLLERLLHHPQVIDKLADSYPIRQAAKVAAGIIVEGRSAAQEAFDKTAKQLSDAKNKLDEYEAKQKQEASSQNRSKSEQK